MPRRRRQSRRRCAKPRRWLRRLFVWGFSLTLLAVMIVAVAVGLTVKSLPSFSDLKNTQVGEQMIVMRGRDGTELVTLGPSYGKWLPYAQIPKVMRDAMVAVEDKRFRSHIGVDPIGIARSIFVRYQSGASSRRLDDHPAAGAQCLPQQRPHPDPQIARSGSGDGD